MRTVSISSIMRCPDSSPMDISPTDSSPMDIPSKSPKRTFRQPYIFTSKLRCYILINTVITVPKVPRERERERSETACKTKRIPS